MGLHDENVSIGSAYYRIGGILFKILDTLRSTASIGLPGKPYPNCQIF